MKLPVSLGPAVWAKCIEPVTPKLDRDVALKVLPQAFTDDPERLARFGREAKVLASLNHSLGRVEIPQIPRPRTVAGAAIRAGYSPRTAGVLNLS